MRFRHVLGRSTSCAAQTRERPSCHRVSRCNDRVGGPIPQLSQLTGVEIQGAGVLALFEQRPQIVANALSHGCRCQFVKSAQSLDIRGGASKPQPRRISRTESDSSGTLRPPNLRGRYPATCGRAGHRRTQTVTSKYALRG